MKHIISLGAGVQSSAMALMAAKGEITPMPDAAIFADPGAEGDRVYEWLNLLETLLPFPVHRVQHQNGLLAALMDQDRSKQFAAIPYYTKSKDGKIGMVRRQCTREYKVEPIEKTIRGLLGLEPYQRVEKGIILATVWIGISLDEAVRMKDSRKHYLSNRWPLIEKRLSRAACLEWMEVNGYPRPAKSACTFCPFHDNTMWRDMKNNDPKSFAQAVEVDEFIRTNANPRFDNEVYIHRSGIPLKNVDFRNAEDLGQGNLFDGFNEECEGMCGV